mgnify:CR=1 FL=1
MKVFNNGKNLLEIENNNETSSTSEENYSTEETSDLKKMTSEDLQSLLNDAVKDEDYDLAMEIQEELKRRNKKID